MRAAGLSHAVRRVKDGVDVAYGADVVEPLAQVVALRPQQRHVHGVRPVAAEADLPCKKREHPASRAWQIERGRDGRVPARRRGDGPAPSRGPGSRARTPGAPRRPSRGRRSGSSGSSTARDREKIKRLHCRVR